MKVSDILRVKGGTLFTVTADSTLWTAVQTMAERDIGSVVVMEYGELVGMLTFREVINSLQANGGKLGETVVRKVMDDAPLTVTPRSIGLVLLSTTPASMLSWRRSTTASCGNASAFYTSR